MDLINRNSKEMDMSRHQSNGQGWRRGRGGLGVALAGAFLLLAGCDGLLDVDLPGQVEARELNDPRLAETLVLGVQADFECGFSHYVFGTGLHADELDSVSTLRNFNIWGSRNDEQRNFGADGCEALGSVAVWRPLQTARFQADETIRRIMEFPQDQIDMNKDLLVGWSHAYAGYSIVLLSEAFCSVTFDIGPEETRAQGFQRAENRFTQAIQSLEGINTQEAESLRNMALVGRARARLNLGDTGGAVMDAAQVPLDFVRYSTHSTTSDRRRNRVHRISNVNRNLSVNARFRGLEVGGAPDPRVSYVDAGVGTDGFSGLFLQQKYASEADDKPIATGREALLIIAEAEGGQIAVDIINQLRATHDLPTFSSSDPLEIMVQVMEERRRELWLQGTRMGDMLRFSSEVLDAADLNWEMGLNNKLEPFGSNTCLPLMRAETDNNPNLG